MADRRGTSWLGWGVAELTSWIAWWVLGHWLFLVMAIGIMVVAIVIGLRQGNA